MRHRVCLKESCHSLFPSSTQALYSETLTHTETQEEARSMEKQLRYRPHEQHRSDEWA